MRKRITSLLVAFAVFVTLGAGTVSEVYAADEDLGKILDGSLLTDDEESIGYVDPDTITFTGNVVEDGIMPYGVYLLSGSSMISKAGSGKIGVTGITEAHKSTNLKVVVTVQRKSGGTWNYVTSWTATKAKGTYLSSTKTLSVTKGYYYRVSCAHVAGGEAGYSYTNGIWIN